jgi:hypothetical protein
MSRLAGAVRGYDGHLDGRSYPRAPAKESSRSNRSSWYLILIGAEHIHPNHRSFRLTPDAVAVLRLFHSVPMNVVYLYLHSQTEAFRRVNQGMGQPNLNTPIIQGFFPLPLLAEQSRIVAKVEELMLLCNRLKAWLTVPRTELSRLLESILHHALSDDCSHEELVKSAALK